MKTGFFFRLLGVLLLATTLAACGEKGSRGITSNPTVAPSSTTATGENPKPAPLMVTLTVTLSKDDVTHLPNGFCRNSNYRTPFGNYATGEVQHLTYTLDDPKVILEAQPGPGIGQFSITVEVGKTVHWNSEILGPDKQRVKSYDVLSGIIVAGVDNKMTMTSVVVTDGETGVSTTVPMSQDQSVVNPVDFDGLNLIVRHTRMCGNGGGSTTPTGGGTSGGTSGGGTGTTGGGTSGGGNTGGTGGGTTTPQDPTLACVVPPEPAIVGQQASIGATGGNGTYLFGSAGIPATGNVSPYKPVFASPGPQAISLVSGNQSKTCTVQVVAATLPPCTLSASAGFELGGAYFTPTSSNPSDSGRKVHAVYDFTDLGGNGRLSYHKVVDTAVGQRTDIPKGGQTVTTVSLTISLTYIDGGASCPYSNTYELPPAQLRELLAQLAELSQQ